jgi:hypothetical protein
MEQTGSREIEVGATTVSVEYGAHIVRFQGRGVISPIITMETIKEAEPLDKRKDVS